MRQGCGCLILGVIVFVAMAEGSPLAWLLAIAVFYALGSLPQRRPKNLRDADAAHSTAVESAQAGVEAAVSHAAREHGFAPNPDGEGWKLDHEGVVFEFHRRPPDDLELLDTESDAADHVPGGAQPVGWRLTVHVPGLRGLRGVIARPSGAQFDLRWVLMGPPAWRQLYHCSGPVGDLAQVLVDPVRPVIDRMLTHGAVVRRDVVDFGSSVLARDEAGINRLVKAAIEDGAALQQSLATGAIPRLVAALGDRSLPPELRRAVATALGRAGEDNRVAQRALAEAIRDREGQVALEAVARYTGDDDAPLLAAATDARAGSAYRTTAIWRLAVRRARHPGALQVAADAWESGDLELRVAALQLGGAVAHPSWPQWLTDATCWPPPSGKRPLITMRRIRQIDYNAPSVAERLKAVLDARHGTEGVAKVIPLESLAPDRDRDATGEEAAFDREEDLRRLAHSAALAMRTYASPAAVTAAVQCVRHPGRHVWPAAMAVLEQHATPACVGALSDALQADGLTEVQTSAIGGLMQELLRRAGDVGGAVSLVGDAHQGAVSLAGDAHPAAVSLAGDAHATAASLTDQCS